MCPVYQQGQAVWHANGLGAETKPAEHVRAHQHRPQRKQDRGSLGCAGARHFLSFVHFCRAGNGTHSLLHKWALHKRSGKEPAPVLQAFQKPLPENHSSPLSLLILMPLF